MATRTLFKHYSTVITTTTTAIFVPTTLLPAVKMADSDVKDMLSAWGLASYIDVFQGKTFFIPTYFIVNIISGR